MAVNSVVYYYLLDLPDLLQSALACCTGLPVAGLFWPRTSLSGPVLCDGGRAANFAAAAFAF